MTDRSAATTRLKDPDTGKWLGVPEAQQNEKVHAQTRYAPQWKLDGYASESEYQVALGVAPAPALAVVAAPADVVTPETVVPTPAQQRMAKARAARKPRTA